MRQRTWRHSPALAISLLALFAALGGTVYAAKKIDGRAIRPSSLPGNRLKPRSVPASRLKPGVLRRARGLPLTGAAIAESTLGQVPSAAHADTADLARSAIDAETALNAVNAIDARTVNGFGAGCGPGTRGFAGACWETSPAPAATAPAAAAECGARGGYLPEALQLAAFAALPGVRLDSDDEWSGDILNYTGPDKYGIATVSPSAVIASAQFDREGASAIRKYRCVFALVG